MPTYQYVCTDCTQPLEAQQNFSDPSLTDCPHCEGRLRKVFSAVGVVFKGTGFYRNDSRKPQEGSENGTASESKESRSQDPDSSKPGGKESGTESSGKESGSNESSGKAPKATESTSSGTTASSTGSGTRPSGTGRGSAA